MFFQCSVQASEENKLFSYTCENNLMHCSVKLSVVVKYAN